MMPTPPPSPRRRPLVLVAEDHDPSFELVRLLCEMEGIAILRAMTTRAVIALARVGRPDLILMGTGLADGDPARAVRALRGDPSLRRIPIVPAGARGKNGMTPDRPVNPGRLLELLRFRFGHRRRLRRCL